MASFIRNMSLVDQGEMVGEQVGQDRSPPPPAPRRHRSGDVVHALEVRISLVEFAIANSRDRLGKVVQDFEEI